MSSRHPSRYEDQTRRSGEPRETRPARDPREARDSRESRESREAREARELISQREGRDIVSPREPRDVISPREIVSSRDPRDVISPREVRDPRETRETRIDQRVEPRIDPSRTDTRTDPRVDARGVDPRVDPRADPRLLPRGDARGESRGDLRGDPRGDPRDQRADPRDVRIDPRDTRDPRDIRDYREPLPMIDPRDPRYGMGRDARDARDVRDPRDVYGRDEMDIDPPTSRPSTSYFLPGEGISREVIQADICRYLGADATCLPARNRDGVSGYSIRAYRMLTTKMIEDLMADSKRWDEELRRSRNNRGTRPAYADTEIHERRQIIGPSSQTPGYTGQQSQMREIDDYDMDDYGRPAPPPQRSLFQSSMPQEYPQNYPVTSGAFQSPPMTAPPDYVLGRGQGGGYGQVPRSEYDMYAVPTAGRGATLQAPNQGQFAPQQGLQGPTPYQDPRTGQMIYPPTAGRGFEQPSRHTGATDGRRRER